MAFSTKLFRIVIKNQYYKSDHIGDDFNIEPTVSTAYWMAKRQIRILRHADGVELIWLSQHYDNPLELFKQKADGITMSFIMTLKNNPILNLSELEAGYPTGQVYYLHNRHTNDNHLLHSKAFMGTSDLVKRHEVDHYPMQPGEDVFAVIDIDMAHWIKKLSKESNTLFVGLITYNIKIQNRSTFWRYYFVDTKKCLNGKFSVLAQEDPSYFGIVNISGKFPHTYCTESTRPMEICDQYDHFFSLCKLDQDGAKNATILETLPYPTHYSLKKDGVNKKKLYSDIVVYV